MSSPSSSSSSSPSGARVALLAALVGFFAGTVFQTPTPTASTSFFFRTGSPDPSTPSSSSSPPSSRWTLRDVPVVPPPSSDWTPLQRAAVDAAGRGPLGQSEVLLGLSTSGAQAELQLGKFVDRLEALGLVPQYVLVALDDAIVSGFCAARKLTCVRRSLSEVGEAASKRTRLGEVVSALKYRVLAEVLAVGVHVLVVDSDIVLLDNPFCWLHRDADIEGASDGASDREAYGGSTEVTDPPLPPPFRFELFFLNSGHFYARATETTLAMIRSVADRVATENVWDQLAYNEELFTPRHEGNSVGLFGLGEGGAALTDEHERWLVERAYAAAARGGASSSSRATKEGAQFERTDSVPPAPGASAAASEEEGGGGGGGGSSSSSNKNLLAERLAWIRGVRRRTAVGGRQPRVRVMDYTRFANSKVAIFLHEVYYATHPSFPCPVTVHVNYHAADEKPARMDEVLGSLFKACLVHSEGRGSCAPYSTDHPEVGSSTRRAAAAIPAGLSPFGGGGALASGSLAQAASAWAAGSKTTTTTTTTTMMMTPATDPALAWALPAPAAPALDGFPDTARVLMDRVMASWERDTVLEDQRGRSAPSELLGEWEE
jgi:hypothetical protein